MIKKILRHPLYALKVACGFVAYKYALLINKPYFGIWMEAHQCHPPRQRSMRMLARRKALEDSRPFYVLEIGAWAGVSTSIWAKVAKEYNGKVYVIDTWKTTDNAPLAMRMATKNDGIFKLFCHNITSAGLEDSVIILRGTSDDKLLHVKQFGIKFDLIYVDGDHSYSQVKKDLENCLLLLRDGGVICGDDLEMQYEDSEKEFTYQNKERDYINDPITGEGYHPGVTVAVAEVLGTVEVENGFWWK